MSNLRNNFFLIVVIVFIGCERGHTCKDYVLSNNFTMLKMENVNQGLIENSAFIIKRNNKIINKGHLEIVENLSKKRILVKLKFLVSDTIYKTDSIFINLKKQTHYITNTKEVCVESSGTPFITVYKIDGVEYTEGEGILKIE